MVDLAVLTAGSKLISNLYSSVKALIDVKKDLDVMDKLEKILELKGTLLDAKEEILSLRERLLELEQAKKLAEEMMFDTTFGVYRGKDDSGNELVFCTKCWVQNQRRAPLKFSIGAYHCATCRTLYSCLGQRPKTKATSSAGVVKPRR